MNRRLLLNTAHHHFATHGLIKSPGFLPAQKLADARNAIYEHLERAGIWKDGQWHLDHVAPGFGMAIIKALDRHPAIIALASGEALAAVHDLAGDQPPFPTMAGHPGLLFTLPNSPCVPETRKHCFDFRGYLAR